MIKRTKYIPIIGLEVHIELATKSKMFCGCKNEHYMVKPNTHVCPVCMGLPGALPVPNRQAVDWTILAGLALGCTINLHSKFDRKHYNYPDLPKGYQISQYDMPIAERGSLELPISNSQFSNKISIRRVHLEEDTGKLVHKMLSGVDMSLVDFNRSGAPLMEIVTEPDIKSASEAVEFAKTLKQIIKYLGISDCDMEKGSMRLEANISVIRAGELKSGSDRKLPDYKVEVKNLNSFKFAQKAIDYEVARQIEVLKSKEIPRQETRGWDEKGKKTVSQRFKESDDDYRYFPEPDIPPMVFGKEEINIIKKSMPILPARYAEEFEKLGVKENYFNQIILDKDQAKVALTIVKTAKSKNIDANDVASVIVNKKIDLTKVEPLQVIEMAKSVKSSGIRDSGQLDKWALDAIRDLPQAVADYKSGKQNAISALVGGVMKASNGKADPSQVQKVLLGKLAK